MIVGKEKSCAVLQYPVTTEDVRRVVRDCCSLDYRLVDWIGEIDVFYYLKFTVEGKRAYLDSTQDHKYSCEYNYNEKFDFSEYKPEEEWGFNWEAELVDAEERAYNYLWDERWDLRWKKKTMDDVMKEQKRVDDLQKKKKRYMEEKECLETKMHEDAYEMICEAECGNGPGAEGFKRICEFFAKDINDAIEQEAE